MWLGGRGGGPVSVFDTVRKHAAKGGHDQLSHGNWARGQGVPDEFIASKAEFKAAQKQAKAKIAKAPVPTKEEVEKAHRDLKNARRAGGESRGGNSRDRRNQRRNLFKEFGGEERGYVVCHGSGVKLHWSRDPEENPNGFPILSRGKVFVKKQGGAYRLSNLLPEFLAYNKHRGDSPLREENTEYM